MADILLEKVLPILIIILLFAGAPLYRFIETELHRRKNDRAPEVCLRATVASKRIDCANAVHPHLRDGGTVYYATFTSDNGTVIELQMGRTNYGRLAEGANGNLTYQGDQFLKFEAFL